MNLTKLDYQLLRLPYNSDINNVVSSIIIQANNGDIAMGPIFEKIESELTPFAKHCCYQAIAKAYYKYIKNDKSYISLTKEICLKDLVLSQDNCYGEEDNSCLDILAITAANYMSKDDAKDDALETINLIIDSGFAFQKYIKLKEKIQNGHVRVN